MFDINKDTIYITRGDTGVVGLSVEGYTFTKGDHVELRVYEENGLKKLPVLISIVDVEEDTEEVDIVLTSEQTKIGEIQNEETIYWYEVELNNSITVVGYDKKGAKEFILYPEGAEEDDT